MKLCITRLPAVGKWVGDLYVAFASWLVRNARLEHNLDVYLHPTTEIKTCKGPAYGFFTPGRKPFIGIACKKRRRESHGCYIRRLYDTFAHEWCEYEKWRDKKTRNHSGLQQRVDALIRRYLRGNLT